MKINPKRAYLLAFLLCLIGVLGLAFMLQKDSSPAPDPATVELAGYYKSSDGVVDGNTSDLIISGDFSEAIANGDFLLTNDREGKLNLTRISDKKTVKVNNNSNAYQLKAVGDDFGYLQEVGETQYMAFLDPETGTSAPLKTEHNVITWDAVGTDISYHLDETTTLGFAKYDNQLGVTEQSEIEGNIATLSQMFVYEGNNYIWVIANKTENTIYAAQTREEVTDKFPVIQKITQANGVIAEIAGNYWIVTASSDGSGKLFSQLWDSAGMPVVNMTITGYTFSGDAVENNGFIYLPVSYTGGRTPDGLLILNSNDHTTRFEDKMQGFVTE